jgi:hypothetical protein
MTDTSEEAARKRAQEQLTAATAAMVTQGNIEAERAEAEKKAKKEAKRKVGPPLGHRSRQCDCILMSLGDRGWKVHITESDVWQMSFAWPTAG